MANRLAIPCCAAVLAAVCGCVSPGQPSRTLRGAGAEQRPAAASAAGRTGPPLAGGQTPGVGPAPAARPPEADPRSQDMSRLMGELQTIGALDPAAQAQLLQDLQQTDPALWPQMVQMFRASLAYRQRAAAGTSPAALPPSPPTVTVAAGAPATAAAPAHSAPPAAADTTASPPHAPAATPPAPPSAPPARYTASPAAAPARPGEVRLASAHAAPAAAADWKASLEAAIAALEKAPNPTHQPADETARQAHLRMLYLAAGRRDDALRPITGATAAEQDFWSQQLYGLSTWLDSEAVRDPARRAAEAAAHLNRAMARLREVSPLLVRNLAFCTEVSSYGVYQQFDKADFQPGQQVILYAEVENLKSEETPRGFHTALRSSYQILDAQGRRVADHDLKLTEEHCHNPRRDYFVRYFITLPERMYDGKHTLQLTIEDTLGQKIGQSSIDFVAHEKPRSSASRKP